MAFAATTGFGDNYINPFAVALGASNFQIGLLTSVSQLVPSITQLKAADVTERVGSRKKIVVRSVFLQASMLLPIATVFYLPRPFQVIALICFYALYVSFSSFAGPRGVLLWRISCLKGRGGVFWQAWKAYRPDNRDQLVFGRIHSEPVRKGITDRVYRDISPCYGFPIHFMLFPRKDARASFGGETGALFFLCRICAKTACRKFWKIRYLPLFFQLRGIFIIAVRYGLYASGPWDFLTLRTPS